jgi:methylenetetrahydrofolate dehydrogenase (NADP+) / methenyltetrahydrofolate cyclohydrolase
MTASLIDGKSFAERLKSTLAVEVTRLKAEYDLHPCVSFVLVGEDPASHYYINAKAKTCASVGIASRDYKLPLTTTRGELLALVTNLNGDASVHGILVQLPLPKHLNEREIIHAIAPIKDVDGFHPLNAGKLLTGEKGMVACTPLGCLLLIKHTLGDIAGKHAVVIGRSNIVGKPMAALLLNESATVTICHSRTHDLAAITSQADIVVAAVGRPEMVKASFIKRGACVIDEVRELAEYITPVPGGVGPMTIACLMRNTVEAACIQGGITFAHEDV